MESLKSPVIPGANDDTRNGETNAKNERKII